MTNFTPDQIFQLNPKIRWVALSTHQGTIVFLKGREGLQSLAPDEETKAFMELNPLVIVGACERQSTWWGDVNSVQVGYGKVDMLIVKGQEHIIACTMEHGVTSRETAEIIRSVRSLLNL